MMRRLVSMTPSRRAWRYRMLPRRSPREPARPLCARRPWQVIGCAPSALAATLVLAAAIPGSARADCGTVGIESVGFASGGLYDWRDPFDHSIAVTIDLRVTTDGEPCDLHLWLGSLRELSAGSESLSFDARAGASVIPPLSSPPQGDSPLRLTTSQADATHRLTASLVVAREQIVGPATYTGQMLVEVFEKNGSSYQIRDSRTGTASIQVVGSATIAVGGVVGGRQIVDFGDLEAGKLSPLVSLQAQSNSPYSLTFESDNGGTLNRDNGSGDWTIDYRARIESGPDLDLDTPANLSRSTPSGNGIDSVGLRLQVDEAARRRSGVYRDILTIIVTPEWALLSAVRPETRPALSVPSR